MTAFSVIFSVGSGRTAEIGFLLVLKRITFKFKNPFNKRGVALERVQALGGKLFRKKLMRQSGGAVGHP